LIADQILPITPVLPEIKAALADGPVILNAPTGSGKTTLVPLALINERWLAGRKIIMLEPRRIAARAAAARMSEIWGEPLGETIGYRIRFDNKVSSKTRVEVVTEGILTRMLQTDPELSKVGLVIFDEFHERSLHADLGLALCLDLCELLDDMRLLIMSATLDTEPLAQLLGGATVITGAGTSHPVSVTYLPPSAPYHEIARNMVRAIELAFHETLGDILAFLPGAGEIEMTMNRLIGRFPTTDILPLYGELSHADQDRVLRPTERRNRRIILATPIAETSITIEGIGCVIDSGFARRPRYNPATGLDRLETVRISRASAEQRRGRAGRLGPGHCYRLWGSEIDQGLLPFTPPEIVTGDLARLVLELALWGVADPSQLRWLDPPRAGSWENARSLLQNLGAVDHKGHITATGRLLAPLPTHPRLSTMLLAAKELGLGATACLIASLFAERDLIKGRFRPCDLRERIRMLQELSDYRSGIVDPQIRRRILKQTRVWKKLLSIDAAEPIHPENCGLLLTFAYPDRLAVLRQGSRTSYQLISGRGIRLPESDHLAGTPFLVAAQVNEGGSEGRIHLAAPVDEDNLHRYLPELFTSRKKIWWDRSSERVRATVENLFGHVALSGIPLADPDQEAVLSVFLGEIQQRGLNLLPWSEEARQVQARVGFMRLREGDRWPDICDRILATELGWLAPYCSGMTGLADLKQLDMKKILQSLLPWDLLQQLDRDAPTHITVPSGSRKKLSYHAGRPPVLAVRLQEMFGQRTTPVVCNGKVNVTLHLLSPANRPIQVTSDLESFWRTTYSKVRKELAGRYPKHYWPDNPHLAKPTKLTQKAMQRHDHGTSS
jgi:ATP-dependent RNA helicase HrpB